jgi:DnaK suppressor protein
MNIATIRAQLNNRQAELLARLNRLTEDSRHTQRLPADFAEQAVELENDDVLLNLDEATRTEIQQIRKAIERLDAGQYGLCDACRRPIAPKRLEALPYATSCLKCVAGDPDTVRLTLP